MPMTAKSKFRDNFEEDNEIGVGMKRINDIQESDLSLLVPQNFFEIPYLSQINVKKKGMESFN